MRSIYSHAQILSNTFWGTMWSRESMATDTLLINLPRPREMLAATSMSVMSGLEVSKPWRLAAECLSVKPDSIFGAGEPESVRRWCAPQR